MQKKTNILILCLFGLIISSSIIGILMNNVSKHARATLVSPRFGAPIQGSPTPGLGKNTTQFLTDTITIWVAPDPAEAPIPSAWKKAENWYGALLPSALRTANCTPLVVKRIYQGSNPLILFGGNLDANPIIPTAIAIEFYVPGDIAPVLYDIVIGFQNPITPQRQKEGEIDLIPKKGSWQGSVGSATENWLQNPQKFILTEPNCIIFPWSEDARSTDPAGKKTLLGKSINPFAFMHVTDTHYTGSSDDVLYYNSLWENDSHVLAPNVIIHTGDLLDHPGDTPSDYDFAYDHLVKLNSPVVLGIGNHDHYLAGPWRYYFGPLYSVTRFDTVSFITIDAILPLGSGTQQWIDNAVKSTRSISPTGPLFYACHYPPLPNYFSGGWIGTVDAMLKQNITAYLTGHYHTDIAAPIKPLINKVLEDFSEDNLGEVLELPNGTQNYLQPITEPHILITRSAGKGSDVIFQERFPYLNNSDYRGYRRISITDNLASNYTYDFDGDGIKDPQISIPNGRFNVTYTEDPNIGIELTAGKTWHLKNEMNDFIPAGRAIFELPKPPIGMTWDLSTMNKTNGAYIRTYLTDGNRYWIDVRVPLFPGVDISIKIEPAIGGII
jgi:hypothetical protein